MSELKKEAYTLSDEDLEQVSGGLALNEIIGDLNQGIKTTGIPEAIEGLKDEVSGLINQLTDKDGQSVVFKAPKKVYSKN